jgi:flagellar biosynthesis regulator FlbT
LQTLHDQRIGNELKNIDPLVHQGRLYEAMKCIRALFKLEAMMVETDSIGQAETLKSTAQLMRNADVTLRKRAAGAV